MQKVELCLIGFCTLATLLAYTEAILDEEFDDGGTSVNIDEYDQNWRKMDNNAFEQPLDLQYESQQQQPTLANVIPQQQAPQTLAEIYKNAQNGQVLLRLKFPHDFNKINPRNPNSLFRWLPTNINVNPLSVADNGAFKLVGGYSQNSGGNGYVRLTSLPYTNQFYQEAEIGTKQNFAVGNRERILGRMALSCRTIDTDKNPFNATEVSRPDDDPRLASCNFQMSNANFGSPLFYFLVINKSVWTVYAYSTFIAKRKVGVRERYDSIVDAGIELDKRQNAVNYYLNGHLVWSINAIGAPPPNDGINKIDYGIVSTTSALLNITEVTFSFGNSKCLDESDPYTSDTTRLVRISPASDPYYSSTSTFYDAVGLRTNIVWGQGASLKAYKLLIIKIESQPLKQSQALPGEYGSSD